VTQFDLSQHISVDDHLVEVPDLWQRWLPSKFADRAPRVVRMSPTADGWQFEDRLDKVYGTAVFRHDHTVQAHDVTYDEMRPGCYDPEARIADMDSDGIAASLCFPLMPGFGGNKFSAAKDKDLGLACIEAYNNYILDEWCATAPGRYIPAVILPLWDAQLAAREVERTAAKGARAIAFTEDPVPEGFPSIHDPDRFWDPVFAAVSEADIPLCMHMGSSSFMIGARPDRPWFATHSLAVLNSTFAFVDWMTSDHFARFPNLRICLSEGGIGWMPHILQHLDDMWVKYPEWTRKASPDLPSSYIRDHVFGCFIEDEFGARNIETIGVGNVMSETDYPHADSAWPNSHKSLLSQLQHLNDEQKYRVLRGNAERFFAFTATGVGQR